jgi:transcription elongation factor Elf1
MRTLTYQCPSCQRKLAPVGGMQTATQVVRRKCQGCGERWQIVVAPSERVIGGQQAWIDIGTLTFLGRAFLPKAVDDCM